MRAHTDNTVKAMLAPASGRNRNAWDRSSAWSFRPMALKKSRFQKLRPYCVRSCRMTLTINATNRSHAVHAVGPRQYPEALCQKRPKSCFSPEAKEILVSIREPQSCARATI